MVKILSGTPDEVLPDLIRIVSHYQNRLDVAWFYIERSNEPIIRQEKHGEDDRRALYKTKSVDYVEEVESRLIDAFLGKYKCSNDTTTSGGPVEDGVWNFVYLT